MLDDKYWEQRYINEEIGWDVGYCTPPIARIADFFDKSKSVLIPGCGNAYEVLYFEKADFGNIHCLDFAATPIVKLKEKLKDNSVVKTFQIDFFKHEGNYDLIVEQTFFCALDPNLRSEYVNKMASLLNDGGFIMGVLFNFPLEKGPPFGGNIDEYRELFSPKFDIIAMSKENKSIKPRLGSELFVILQKK